MSRSACVARTASRTGVLWAIAIFVVAVLGAIILHFLLAVDRHARPLAS